MYVLSINEVYGNYTTAIPLGIFFEPRVPSSLASMQINAFPTPTVSPLVLRTLSSLVMPYLDPTLKPSASSHVVEWHMTKDIDWNSILYSYTRLGSRCLSCSAILCFLSFPNSSCLFSLVSSIMQSTRFHQEALCNLSHGCWPPRFSRCFIREGSCKTVMLLSQHSPPPAKEYYVFCDVRCNLPQCLLQNPYVNFTEPEILFYFCTRRNTIKQVNLVIASTISARTTDSPQPSQLDLERNSDVTRLQLDKPRPLHK